MADGTAPQCGRVGSCHIYFESLSLCWGFLVYGLSSMDHRYINTPLQGLIVTLPICYWVLFFIGAEAAGLKRLRCCNTSFQDVISSKVLYQVSVAVSVFAPPLKLRRHAVRPACGVWQDCSGCCVPMACCECMVFWFYKPVATWRGNDMYCHSSLIQFQHLKKRHKLLCTAHFQKIYHWYYKPLHLRRNYICCDFWCSFSIMSI